MPIGSIKTMKRCARHAVHGLPPLRGWWFSLATGLRPRRSTRPIAGNLGLNYAYTTSKSRFGGTPGIFRERTTDIVLTQESAAPNTPAGLVPLGERSPRSVNDSRPMDRSPGHRSIRCSVVPTGTRRPLRDRYFASVYLHTTGTEGSARRPYRMLRKSHRSRESSSTTWTVTVISI
jgi:hypothetical protein